MKKTAVYWTSSPKKYIYIYIYKLHLK
jgi:hypothetical protein